MMKGTKRAIKSYVGESLESETKFENHNTWKIYSQVILSTRQKYERQEQSQKRPLWSDWLENQLPDLMATPFFKVARDAHFDCRIFLLTCLLCSCGFIKSRQSSSNLIVYQGKVSFPTHQRVNERNFSRQLKKTFRMLLSKIYQVALVAPMLARRVSCAIMEGRGCMNSKSSELSNFSFHDRTAAV